MDGKTGVKALDTWVGIEREYKLLDGQAYQPDSVPESLYSNFD
jgi:hypothetical protein